MEKEYEEVEAVKENAVKEIEYLLTCASCECGW